MDRIGKFFRKISKKDNLLLEKLILSLLNGEIKDLNIKKLTDSDFYRLRKNRFRIIFHYEKKEVIIDSVKLRDDKTYK
jgi:mRNA-degrading endonuclease RelE of RelBE toxin-antitoxin system